MKPWVPAVYLGIFQRRRKWGIWRVRQGRRIVQAAAVGGEALPRGSLWKHRAPHANTHPAEGSVTGYPHTPVGSGLPLVVATF